MNQRTLFFLLGGFAVCYLALGIPYWRLPYNQDPPSSLTSLGLLLLLGTGMASRLLTPASWIRCTLFVGASVPALVMTRVLIDTASDPTTHNLWPFELVIAAVCGFGPAALGTAIGGLLRRLMNSAQH